jgi:hypothetical protein
MQKIFIVNQELISDSDNDGNHEIVNDFIKDGGKIISVTSQIVARGNNGGERGRWLVAADDGKGIQL